MTSRVIEASELKAKCLELIDEVAATGEALTVTKSGRPVVELRPRGAARARFLGRIRGKIASHDDPVEALAWCHASDLRLGSVARLGLARGDARGRPTDPRLEGRWRGLARAEEAISC